MEYIIIGGGIAGTTCAEEIRAHDASCSITIIESEEHPCYSRVLLPHYVKGKIPRERVFLRNFQQYIDKNIELLTSTDVTNIDPVNHFVTTNDHRELPFTKLIIATGTEPRLLDEDAFGASYLYNLSDADQLCTHLARATASESLTPALTYGGGFMACEFANIFAHLGLPFTMLMRSAGFWSNTLSAASQDVLKNHVLAQGHNIRTNTTIEHLSAERGELRGVVLRGGEVIPTTLLGVGIGTTQNTSLFTAAKLSCDDGVTVNTNFSTENKDIFAIGDASSFLDPLVGRHIRYANWASAQFQGRHLGGLLTTNYLLITKLPPSQYSTSLLGLPIAFLGDTNRAKADEITQAVLTPTAAEELFFRAGRLVGAVLLGDLSNRPSLLKRLGS